MRLSHSPAAKPEHLLTFTVITPATHLSVYARCVAGLGVERKHPPVRRHGGCDEGEGRALKPNAQVKRGQALRIVGRTFVPINRDTFEATDEPPR